MDPIKLKPDTDLERQIQDRIMAYLKARDWFVKETHGNMFQSGFPDLYATHNMYGQRWIEVKRPYPNYSFTPAQMENFPKFTAFGSGIWILTEANDEEYAKLFKAHNWYGYVILLGGKAVRSPDANPRSAADMLRRI